MSMNRNDRAILSVTTVGHGMVHAYELAIPIFIPLWMATFDTNAAVIGFAVSIGYAMYGVGAVPSGLATDRRGSQWLIGVCLLGMGGSFLLLGLVDSVLGIAAVLAVWGAAASIYHPAGLRLISTGVHQRGTAFGYHGIAGNVGIATGPLVAVVGLFAFDWQLVAIGLGLPAIAAGLFAVSVTIDELAAAPAGARNDSPSAAWSQLAGSTKQIFAGGFLLVFPIVILEGFFYRGVLTFLPDVLGRYEALAPIEMAGRAVDPAQYVFVGILVVGMVGQFVGGHISDRMPPDRAAVGAFVLLAAISVLFVPAALAGLVPLLVVSAALGFVLFGEQPLLQAVVADYSATDVRGLSYGYMFLGVFGIGAIGATFSGVVLAMTTEEALFLLLAIVPALAAILAARLSIGWSS